MRTRFFSLLCFLVLGGGGALAPADSLADIVVVVHRDNPVPELTARQVSDLYLGRARSLGTVNVPIIYEQPADSALRERFFLGLNGMSLKQLNAYWARLRFSGEVLPPATLSDSRAVMNSVRRERGAIGYVDSGVLDGSVRVVLVVKE